MKLRDYVILTQIALIVLKVVGVINWPWIYVVVPIVSYSLFVILVAIVGVFIVIRKARKDLEDTIKNSSRWQQRVDEIRKRK